MSWLQEKYPQEGMSKKDNTNTHIHYIQKCKNKKALPGKKGYWDHSVRLYYDYIGSLYGKTMTSAVHSTEERYLSIRDHSYITSSHFWNFWTPPPTSACF